MEDNILDNLVVSVTGLGYVGLPIALAFSKNKSHWFRYR